MSAPTTKTPPLLQVEGLSKHFVLRGRGGNKTLRAVDDINFTLEPSETMAIVGESGSGKSTLARSLLRLLEPTSGTVHLRGQSLTDMTHKQLREARRSIQMVFQDPYASLHPRHTVAEIISEPWRVHRGIYPQADYAKQVDILLSKVGLSPNYAPAYPYRLSGGERQRVAIARALALAPQVLILDEPVSALDVSIQAQVIKLLMQLQLDMQIGYLFISHDLPLVRLVADKVAVMYMGRFVEQGPADEVFAAPRHPYTKMLLAAVPNRQNAPTNEPASEPTNPFDIEAGCAFAPRCPMAQDICRTTAPNRQTGRLAAHSFTCHFSQ
ncbi:MAG: peptide ABC transporter ATP-binding protein [Robiginitomaculum sp.]|nr:MAG: peptide ABC transporter ATP-binding protein [Robiginitomaculum sp.]